jgi:hypothetical protein
MRGSIRPNLRTLRTAVVLSATVLTTSDCFFGKRAPSHGDPPDWAGDIPLQVVNHNWLDMTIYVIHGGQRTRVGQVPGSGSTTFSLSRLILGQGREIQLFADPIGSPEQVTSQTLVVLPGQYIEWTLETSLARSSAGVY